MKEDVWQGIETYPFPNPPREALLVPHMVMARSAPPLAAEMPSAWAPDVDAGSYSLPVTPCTVPVDEVAGTRRESRLVSSRARWPATGPGSRDSRAATTTTTPQRHRTTDTQRTWWPQGLNTPPSWRKRAVHVVHNIRVLFLWRQGATLPWRHHERHG